MGAEEKHYEIAGILLAAGESSRLGRPKQMLEIAGESLVHRAARTALGYCTAGLVVVTGAVHDPIVATLAPTPARIVHNPEWQEGMGASLRCGVAASPANADAFLLVLCDQPRIGRGELGALVDAWTAAPEAIAAAGYAGSCGVPAIFPARFRDRLLALRGERGARALLEEEDRVSVVDMPAAAFDIDTPEDAGRLP